jgi:cytochrome b561
VALRNSADQWGLVAQILHWMLFLLIGAQFVLATLMDDAPKGPGKTQLLMLHKSVGITVLALVLLRIGWRWANPVPVPLARHAWQVSAGRIVHFLLYLVMLLMPLTGMVMVMAAGRPIVWFGLFEIRPLIPTARDLSSLANDLHGLIAYLILGLLAVHITAAGLHHYVWRDNTVRRMIVPGRR